MPKEEKKTLWMTYTDKRDGKTYAKFSKDGGATWSEPEELITIQCSSVELTREKPESEQVK